MISFEIEGRLIELPDISPVLNPVFEIQEGPFAGVWFTLHDTRGDDTQEDLLHYEVEVSGATVDEIKPILDNFILHTLKTQIEREKAKNATV